MAELSTVALMMLALAAAGIAVVRLGLPAPLGYLAVGLAASALAPQLVPGDVTGIIAELAVLVLLFFIGLELDLKRLRSALRATALTMPFDVAVPALTIAAAARLLGWSFHEAIALGIALAISSTLFGERLTTAGNVTRGARERVLGVLVSEDVAAAGLIGVLVVLAGGSGGWTAPILEVGRLVFFLLLMAGGALLVVPRVLDQVARRHMPELLVLWAAGLVVAFGYLGHLAGSAELGALIAGVAAAEAGSRYVVRNNFGGIRDVSAALFFLASGIVVDVLDVWANIGLILIVAGVFLVCKVGVHIPAAIQSRVSLKGSMQTAFALATVGEFSLILAAVAEREGIAHPLLGTVAVGSMVVLLPVAALGVAQTDRIERGFWRLPLRVRRPLVWLGRSTRRSTADRPVDPQGRRAALRMLFTNILLLGGWLFVAFWLRRRFEDDVAALGQLAPIVGAGVTLAGALPFAIGAYRAYRDLVWRIVGLRAGERAGAGNVRARLVDAWVALSVVLLLLLATLRFPSTLPVLAGGAFLAAVLVGIAWRQLSRFHRTLEATLGRVLGHDEKSSRLLDQVVDRYPWGVRFTAVVVPPGSSVAHQSLLDARIAALTGAMVAVLQRGRKEIVNPKPDEVVRPGDTLVLLGDAHQISRAEALVVSHGDAVRMSAQSVAAQVEEVLIEEASPWAGVRLEETGIRAATGTLVIGVWKAGRQHPVPYASDLWLEPGDRLILLGTPLQLQRARIRAEGIPEARD